MILISFLKSLLAAKTDGNFIGIDTFQERNSTSNHLEFMFNHSTEVKKRRNMIHTHSISCIQWYPIDTGKNLFSFFYIAIWLFFFLIHFLKGMFFTSGMDEKFKVWDTNSLEVVDEYALRHKIYSHHISTLNASSTKTLIALALDNGEIRFIDLNSGSFTHTLKAHSHGYCGSVQWSPANPNLLASSGYTPNAP